METIDNSLENHQELITHLMQSHMSSFSVRTYLTSMLGHSQILSSETFGQLNERQRESIDIVVNSTKKLQEHLDVFIITARLLFAPDRYYENDCNILSLVEGVVKQSRKTTDFKIESKLPESIPLFIADENLISDSLNSILRIIKQIHPTHKGQITITTEIEESLVRILFSTNKDQSMFPPNENPDLFIAQTVAKLHDGEFIVDTNDKTVNLILTLSMSAHL